MNTHRFLRRRAFHRWALRSVLAAGAAPLAAAAPPSEVAPAPGGASTPGEEATPANIVLVLTDDQRFDQLSAAGHPYLQTPNLDRLAAEGTRYDRAYVTCPLCGPSRGSLFTGRMPSAHGVINHDVLHSMQYPEGVFLPGLLQEAGYETAKIGKWFQGTLTPRPEFDRWFVNAGVPLPEGVTPEQRQELYRAGVYVDMQYNVDGVLEVIEGYNTDICFDETLRFLAAPGDRPKAVFLSIFAPHFPYRPPAKDAGRFEGLGIPDRPNLDLEALPKGRRLSTQRDYERQTEMIPAIDRGVGRLLDALEEAGELDDTLILFTSDNGFLWGEHGVVAKRSPYEESIRVPLLARWPGRFAADAVSEELVSLADLGVTMAAAAGAKPPAGLYGRSILPGTSEPRPDLLVQQYEVKGDSDEPVWASLVTADGWKLTVFHPDPAVLARQGPHLADQEGGLYHLAEDPVELNNLLDDPAAAPERERLRGLLKQRLSENGATTDWMGF